MAVALDLGMVSGDQVEGISWERLKGIHFDLLEASQRCLLGGAVKAHASLLEDPLQDPPVEGLDVAESLSGQEGALDIVDTGFDLAFMMRRAGTVGADQESKVLSQTAVRLTQNRILKVGFEDRGFEVVEDHPLDDTAEKLEGMFMTGEPGGDLLVEDELDILMAGPGEGHHEHPGFSLTAC